MIVLTVALATFCCLCCWSCKVSAKSDVPEQYDVILQTLTKCSCYVYALVLVVKNATSCCILKFQFYLHKKRS